MDTLEYSDILDFVERLCLICKDNGVSSVSAGGVELAFNSSAPVKYDDDMPAAFQQEEAQAEAGASGVYPRLFDGSVPTFNNE